MIEFEQGQFDYAMLDVETRTFVQAKAQAIHTRLKRTAEDVIAIGLDLIAVKERLQYGEFVAWLQCEFDMNVRSAQRFMSVATRFAPRNDKLSFLPISVLYELAAPSTPDTVIELVASGTIAPTLPAIREAKRSLSSPDDLPATFGLVDGEPFTLPLPDGKPIEISEEWKLPTELRSVSGQDEREIRRQQARDRIEQLRAHGVDLPSGTYSCIVCDPPWPMQKIERDVRPNQVEFDYPTMTEEELQSFRLPDLAADDCHLYLWTTQKYLPMALRLAEHWGFKYQCLMTWVKNVGFTPFSWMYSTEHVLFCTRGNLPLLQVGRRLDFGGKVREHSRKPEEFYDLVKQVSPGPRIDVFSREKREGFDQFGNEVEKFAST